ncbi:hypothetical protein Tco_0994683 [Tanacetum coccineum]
MSNPPNPSASSSSSSQFTYANNNNNSYFPMPFHLQQPQSYPPAPVYPAPPSSSSLPGVYFPQFQQAQQLFQRDAQTITPEALESVKAALASSEVEHKAEVRKKAIPRKAAGLAWEDPTLAEWPERLGESDCNGSILLVKVLVLYAARILLVFTGKGCIIGMFLILAAILGKPICYVHLLSFYFLPFMEKHHVIQKID